jgi:hypothetical protein
MAGIVANLGANYANLRYRHPFVTEGLNKKVVGMPSGILQGGKLTAAVGNQSVVVNTDPDTGLSVYNYERRSSPLSAVTVIEEADRTIDLSVQAGTTVYVCLYVEYTVTTTTLVQFRTYTESELFGASPVTEAGDVVILGKVNVPATAVPIPDEDVVGDHRTDAWQRRSVGSRDWRQIFRNGSGAIPYLADPPLVSLPYMYSQVVLEDNWALEYSSTYTRSMTQSLRCNIGGSGAAIIFTPATCLNSTHASPVFTPIRSGSRIMFSFYKRAASWTGDSAGYFNFTFRPAPDDNDGSDVLVQHEFSAGTTDSDWVHVTGVVEAPSDCWFLYGFGLSSSGANTGYIYFDDIRVWVEAGNALEDEGAVGSSGINSPAAGSAFVLFPANTVDDSDEFVEGAVEFSGSYDGTTPSIDLMWLKGGTSDPFDFNVYADLYLSRDLYLAGDLHLTGSDTQFEYDQVRTVVKEISLAALTAGEATPGDPPGWVFSGNDGYWLSDSNSGRLWIPIALPIDSGLGSSITVEVMVKPGAERTGNDRVTLVVSYFSPNWSVPARPTALNDGGTWLVYDDGTTDYQVIAATPDTDLVAGRTWSAYIRTGATGATEIDEVCGVRITYTMGRVPRAHCSV